MIYTSQFIMRLDRDRKKPPCIDAYIYDDILSFNGNDYAARLLRVGVIGTAWKNLMYDLNKYHVPNRASRFQ